MFPQYKYRGPTQRHSFGALLHELFIAAEIGKSACDRRSEMRAALIYRTCLRLKLLQFNRAIFTFHSDCGVIDVNSTPFLRGQQLIRIRCFKVRCVAYSETEMRSLCFPSNGRMIDRA
jgi:hypothetical protein